MIYLTSDTHLGHHNVLKYNDRPFPTIEEHDRAIIANINATVGKDDMLYIIGDFAFGNPLQYTDKIICKNIHLVLGNHDHRWMKKLKQGFASVRERRVFNHNDICICLDHYPSLSWHNKHYGSYHFFGHVHDKFLSHSKAALNVGVDWWEYKPISIYDAITLASEIDPDYSWT